MSSDNKPADVSGLFDAKEEVKKWITSDAKEITSLKEQILEGSTGNVTEVKEDLASGKTVDDLQLYNLGQELEKARAGRHVGDIRLNDPYWNVQRKLQAYYHEHK